MPILVGTLALQLGALFMCYRRNLTLEWLLGYELLHIGIFLMSGICFWKWILLNIGLIILMKKLDENCLRTVFSRKYFILSLIVILCSPLYFKPVWLAWFDTKFNNYYRVEVIGESGSAY